MIIQKLNGELEDAVDAPPYNPTWFQRLSESIEGILQDREIDRNYAAFIKTHRRELLKKNKEGFVLLHSGKVLDVYDNIGTAIEEGNKQCKNGRFSVQNTSDER